MEKKVMFFCLFFTCKHHLEALTWKNVDDRENDKKKGNAEINQPSGQLFFPLLKDSDPRNLTDECSTQKAGNGICVSNERERT